MPKIICNAPCELQEDGLCTAEEVTIDDSETCETFTEIED